MVSMAYALERLAGGYRAHNRLAVALSDARRFTCPFSVGQGFAQNATCSATMGGGSARYATRTA